MPIFLESPNHDPKGPDGGGWNRLRVDVYLSNQCAMQPKSYASLRYESQNTILARWGNFGHCFNDGRCKDCELMNPSELDVFGDKVLVRLDSDNQPWIMNRPDKGWGEYGVPYPWSFFARLEGWQVGEKYRDEH